MIQNIALFLILAGIAALIYLAKISLPKYIARKAENLAQKEDLQDLTNIVEKVRTQFERANLVHRVQFEAEFRAHQQVWKEACSTHRTFICAFPSPLFAAPSIDNYTKFIETHAKFLDALQESRPFVPSDIIDTFSQFDDLMVDAKGRGISPSTPEDVTRYRRAATESLEKSADAIRTRLSELLVLE